MNVTALQPWFGSKRTLAPRIIELMGPHRVYWELFCGSCAVTLAKPPAVMETINDLHGDLTNLARVIRDEELSMKLHWKIARTIPAEGIFRESKAVINMIAAPSYDHAPDMIRAYHYLVQGWLGMSGVAGTHSHHTGFARRFNSNGGAPAKRFASMSDSLPWWHERLRGVFILSQCGIDLAKKIEDNDDCVIYCDPPYLVKGEDYLHDFTPEQHRQLASTLSRFRLARVLVSYYNHPLLDELYPGWHRIDMELSKSLGNSARREKGKKEKAPELVLCNFTPTPNAETDMFAGVS